MPEIMIAAKPGFVYIDGRRYMVRKGKTTAHATHPVVTEHPKLWQPLRVDYPAPDVETVDVSTHENPGATIAVDPTTGAVAAVPEGAVEPAGGQDTDQDDAAVERAAIRSWAADNGIEVSPRGKIPAAVVDQYRAAQGG